jgi:hypothetical protein
MPTSALMSRTAHSPQPPTPGGQGSRALTSVPYASLPSGASAPPTPPGVRPAQPTHGPAPWSPAHRLRNRRTANVPAERLKTSNLASADIVLTSVMQVQLTESYLSVSPLTIELSTVSTDHTAAQVTERPPKSRSARSCTPLHALEAVACPCLHPPPVVRRIRHPKVR